MRSTAITNGTANAAVCVCVCVFSVGSHTLCIVFFFRLCHIPRLYVGFFIYSLTVLPFPPSSSSLCVRALCLLWCDVAYCVFNVFPSLFRWPLTLEWWWVRTEATRKNALKKKKLTGRLLRWVNHLRVKGQGSIEVKVNSNEHEFSVLCHAANTLWTTFTQKTYLGLNLRFIYRFELHTHWVYMQFKYII